MVNTSNLYSGITVKKLLLFTIREQSTVFNRPYVMNPDGQAYDQTVNSIIGHFEANHVSKTPTMDLAALPYQLITPSATADNSYFTFSNDGRVYRFFIEVELSTKFGNVKGLYMQGYTSHDGVTPNGSIDPRMVFYINSVVETFKTVVQTPMGNYLNEQIGDVYQILRKEGLVYIDQQMVNMQQPAATWSQGIYMQRPYDIYNIAEDSLLKSQYAQYNVISTRTSISNMKVSETNNRKNNQPLNYLSNVIDNSLASYSSMDPMAPDPSSELRHAYSMRTNEVGVKSNAFLSYMASMAGYGNQLNNPVLNGAFDHAQLSTCFNYIDSVTELFNINSRLTDTSTPDTGEYWSSNTIEAATAFSIINAASSIASDSLLTSVKFTCDNISLITREPNFQFIDAPKSFITGASIEALMQRFADKIMYEVFTSHTYSNTMNAWMEVHIDLLGTSKINISMNNQPAIWFTLPSFADSAFTPNISTNSNGRDAFAIGIFNFTEDLNDSINSNQVLHSYNDQNNQGYRR